MRNGLTVLFALGMAVPAVAQTRGTTAEDQRAQVHYEEGWKDLAGESYEEAAREFTQATELNPKFKLAYYGLGRADMGLKRFPDAVKSYETCRDLYQAKTGDNFANQMEADRMRQDDQSQLQSAIRQLQAKNPNSQANQVQVRALQAQSQRIQNKREQGRDLSLGASVPAFVSLALGSAYFRSAKLTDAEREYKAAIGIDPKAGEAWNNLAVVYLDSQRYDEADRAVNAAEKAGFHVHPELKDEIRKKRAGS